MVKDGFDCLLTFDKNLQYQQNFGKYTITVFVLTATINTYRELTKLSGRIQHYLLMKKLPLGTIIIKPE